MAASMPYVLAPNTTVAPSMHITKVGKGILVYLFITSGGISIPPVLAPTR